MASSIVSVLGGHPYSNTLYGRDTRGQLVKFNTLDTSYTLISNSMLDAVKSKAGFVAAKSYNRTMLLNTNLTSEFVVHGKNYGSTYSEISPLQRSSDKNNEDFSLRFFTFASNARK